MQKSIFLNCKNVGIIPKTNDNGTELLHHGLCCWDNALLWI